jgi:hypothetical protein
LAPPEIFQIQQAINKDHVAHERFSFKSRILTSMGPGGFWYIGFLTGLPFSTERGTDANPQNENPAIHQNNYNGIFFMYDISFEEFSL